MRIESPMHWWTNAAVTWVHNVIGSGGRRQGPTISERQFGLIRLAKRWWPHHFMAPRPHHSMIGAADGCLGAGLGGLQLHHHAFQPRHGRLKCLGDHASEANNDVCAVPPDASCFACSRANSFPIIPSLNVLESYEELAPSVILLVRAH
jgi:hypothetical protein